MTTLKNKKQRIVFLSTFLITAILIFPINTIHAASSPISLKVNQYFVLYTQPSVPFIDSKGRLLVPLRTFEDVLGGEVTYNKNKRSAEVKWLDHTFEATIGSQKAKMDGQSVTLDTTPVIKKQAMFLPIKLFLSSTDLKWSWNQENHQIIMNDERLDNGKVFQQFAGNDVADVANENALTLISYSIVGNNLSIFARNSSGHNIAKGKADIQPLISYQGTNGFAVDSYSRPSLPLLPAVANGKTIEKKVTFDLQNVAYIISVGRELK